MKLNLALVFFIVASSCLGQSKLNWQDPKSVNSNVTFGYHRPKVVLTAGDVPLVMWGRANNKEIYVSRLNGSEFEPAVKVTPDGVDAFVQSWAGPDMGASGDTVFIVFKSQPEQAGFIYVVRSIDGGLSFGDTVKTSPDNWSRFPAISVLPGGNPVITYMQFDSNFTNPRYAVVTSSNGGNSFENPVDATESAAGEACDCCPGFVLANQEQLFVLYRNNDNNIRDIWTCQSTDYGATFPVAEHIDISNWMINSCPSTGPHAIIYGDSLVAVWMSGASGFSRVNIATRSIYNLGYGWNSEITPGINSTQNYPKVAGGDGLLAITWQQIEMGTTNVKFIFSDEGAQSLVNLTADTVNTNLFGANINPDMTYSKGTFHIVWQDNGESSVMYRSVTAHLDTPSGLSAKKNASYSLYPNPAETSIFIKRQESELNISELVIYNSLGQKISVEFEMNSDFIRVNVSSLDAGKYLIRIKDKEGYHHNRFFVI